MDAEKGRKGNGKNDDSGVGGAVGKCPTFEVRSLQCEVRSRVATSATVKRKREGRSKKQGFVTKHTKRSVDRTFPCICHVNAKRVESTLSLVFFVKPLGALCGKTLAKYPAIRLRQVEKDTAAALGAGELGG